MAVIHIEFTRLRKANPHRSVAEIMSEIKSPFGGRNEFPVKAWMQAKRDYQRDAQKMYEQNAS